MIAPRRSCRRSIASRGRTHSHRDHARAARWRAVDVEMHASAFEVGGHRYLLAFDRDVTVAQARRSRAQAAWKRSCRRRRSSRASACSPAASPTTSTTCSPASSATPTWRAGRTRVPESAVPRSDRAIGRARRRPLRPDARLRRQGALRGQQRRPQHAGRRDHACSSARRSASNVTLDLALARDLPLDRRRT